MRDELTNAIRPMHAGAAVAAAAATGAASATAATIGDANLNLRPMPIRKRIDFYDTTGRLHGLIVLVPLLYGIIQVQRGQELSPWFWLMVLATFAFALFVHRPACVRLTPTGISMPDRGPIEYAWNEMAEARAREGELHILMGNGLRVQIPYRRLRGHDIERLKRLVRWQFEAMAARAAEAPAPAPASPQVQHAAPQQVAA
jgi:hypothetical protein